MHKVLLSFECFRVSNTVAALEELLGSYALYATVLLLIITGKEKEKSLSGDRLKNPNNNTAASGDIKFNAPEMFPSLVSLSNRC
jgi:hypothetical protein